MRPLTVLLLTACTPLQPQNQICPPGSAGPVPDVSQPQTLGEGENHPVAIAVRGDTLFWLNHGPPAQMASEGAVVSRGLCSGLQKILASGQNRPTAMAVDGEFIYWVNAGRDNDSGELMRVPTSGDDRDVRRLSMNEKRPAAIAVDGGTIYFVSQGDLDTDGIFVPGTGALRRFDPVAQMTTTLVDALDAPSGVAARNGVVTWTAAGRGALVDIDGNGVLHKTFAEGTGSIEGWESGQRAVLAAALNAPVAVVMASPHIYWIERGVKRGTGRLSREDTHLAEGLDFPGALAIDGDDIYSAVTGAEDEAKEGHVFRHRLGVPEVELAAAQQLPHSVAVDRHLVYWVNYGRIEVPDGEVLVRWKAAP